MEGPLRIARGGNAPLADRLLGDGGSGLDGLSGTVAVEPYRGQNPLFLHGPLRVAPDRRHFEHLDETPFFWLGDTWWMGLCRRLHWPDEFQNWPPTGRPRAST